MLVLSRRKGERIQIGEDISVIITKINGNRVSIGIEAPPHVSIQRAERLIAETLQKAEKKSQPVNRIRQFIS